MIPTLSEILPMHAHVSALLVATAVAATACSQPAPLPPPEDTSGIGPAPSGTATGDAPKPSAGGKTLFVDAQLIDCEGEGPMKCLRVREREADEWRLLYQGISGFTHEAGHAYELRVTEETRKNPPADGASRRYVLLEIVSKKAVAPAP